ncbi:TrmB family transcriptional regulator [Haloferax denitrificans]|uniref:TrmB family transcriptional regulator n=1 Tax=Haloferax denitrificans TaxID=35745 RepID=UPI003C6F136F
MDQLVQMLQDVMDWTQYEASAYRTLVQDGPLEASELAVRSDVSKGKEYDVLNKLASKDLVVKQGTHPQRFDAQDPRQLLNEREGEFQDRMDELKQRLGAAYEMNAETKRVEDEAWVTTGRAGLARKIREYYNQADESVYLKQWDPRWVESTDIRDLSIVNKGGVDVRVLGFSGRESKLMEFAAKGIPTWMDENVESSFCVFDGEIVAMEVGRGRAGIVFRDSSTATVFINHFQQSIERANRLDPDA